MNKNFLSKKSWHTGSLKHIEKVWKAEQEDAAERKKLHELEKQLALEREKEDLNRIKEESGLYTKKEEKIDWLYEVKRGPSSEDYLTGKAAPVIDEEKAESNTLALFQNNKAAGSAQDTWNKIRDDPLMMMKKKEIEARQYIKNNPIKMEIIRSMLEKEKKKKKHKKEKKSKERNGDNLEKKEKKKEKKEKKKDKKKTEESSDESLEENGQSSNERGPKSSRGRDGDRDRRDTDRKDRDSYHKDGDRDRRYRERERDDSHGRYSDRRDGDRDRKHEERDRDGNRGRDKDIDRVSYRRRNGGDRDRDTNSDRKRLNNNNGMEKNGEQKTNPPSSTKEDLLSQTGFGRITNNRNETIKQETEPSKRLPSLSSTLFSSPSKSSENKTYVYKGAYRPPRISEKDRIEQIEKMKDDAEQYRKKRIRYDHDGEDRDITALQSEDEVDEEKNADNGDESMDRKRIKTDEKNQKGRNFIDALNNDIYSEKNADIEERLKRNVHYLQKNAREDTNFV